MLNWTLRIVRGYLRKICLVLGVCCIAALSNVGSLVWAQQDSDQDSAFSYTYRGLAAWALDEPNNPQGQENLAKQPLPDVTNRVTVRAKSRPTKPLLPIVPAPSHETAPVADVARTTVAAAQAACTDRSMTNHGPGYFERVSVSADTTVPIQPKFANQAEDEPDEEGGFFGIPDRTTLVSFRETTVDVARNTVQGVGETMRTSRGKLSELGAQLDIFRPRRYCEECDQRHRRTPIRRFMALLRGSGVEDPGTLE